MRVKGIFTFGVLFVLLTAFFSTTELIYGKIFRHASTACARYYAKLEKQ